MKNGIRMIYSSIINEDDWDIEDAKEYYDKDEISDHEFYEYCVDTNNTYFEDVYEDELNIPINGPILCISDIGRWNGRFAGYKIINKRNIKNCLDICSNYDDMEIYCDRNNLCANLHHHDGTNYVIFKEIREDKINSSDIDGFFYAKMMNSKNDFHKLQNMIQRYTRSLRPYIEKEFGWSNSKKKRS